VVCGLHKSKLQVCVKILCSLSSNASLKLSQISHEVELDKPRLIPYLSFLYDRGLVGEQNLDEDEKAYFVTERGVSVLKVVSPLIREAQRIEVHNFEAISSALSGAKVTSGVEKEKRPKRKWKLSDFIKIEIVEKEDSQKSIL
jgi:predicted transcriptional regulator